MRLKTLWFGALLVGLAITVPAAWAQQQPTPEMLKAQQFFETAGIPGDRWIEGETMVPHVAPARHFNATMLYYPGTEEASFVRGRSYRGARGHDGGAGGREPASIPTGG